MQDVGSRWLATTLEEPRQLDPSIIQQARGNNKAAYKSRYDSPKTALTTSVLDATGSQPFPLCAKNLAASANNQCQGTWPVQGPVEDIRNKTALLDSSAPLGLGDLDNCRNLSAAAYFGTSMLLGVKYKVHFETRGKRPDSLLVLSWAVASVRNGQWRIERSFCF
jgi:hypothetical protein